MIVSTRSNGNIEGNVECPSKLKTRVVILRTGRFDLDLYVFTGLENKCEWCGAQNGKLHPITASRVVLTCAHVYDKRPEQASLLNLAALCQRCHLNHDRKDRNGWRIQTPTDRIV